MASLNKALLIGHVGQAPELKQTGNSKPLCKFTLATNERRKGKQEETTWHTVICFDQTAEAVSNYVSKGSMVYVEGRIQTRSWEKDGAKKYATEIVAERVVFLDNNRTSGVVSERAGHSSGKSTPVDNGNNDDEPPF